VTTEEMSACFVQTDSFDKTIARNLALNEPTSLRDWIRSSLETLSGPLSEFSHPLPALGRDHGLAELLKLISVTTALKPSWVFGDGGLWAFDDALTWVPGDGCAGASGNDDGDGVQ
jgi:hypothetical protein